MIKQFNHYKNLLFANQEARKIIGGRWVKQKETGQWMQWSSSDDTWMRGEKLQREDWGRKRPVRKLIEHAKRYLSSARNRP